MKSQSLRRRIATETGVVCEAIFTIKEAENDLSDICSHEESSDEDKESDPDSEEELSQKAKGGRTAQRRRRDGRGPDHKKEKAGWQTERGKAAQQKKYHERVPLVPSERGAMEKRPRFQMKQDSGVRLLDLVSVVENRLSMAGV